MIDGREMRVRAGMKGEGEGIREMASAAKAALE